MRKRPWVRGGQPRKRVLRQRRIHDRFAEAWEALKVQAEELRSSTKPRTA
ncbi:MAG: hypothetical protein ACT4PE_00900 [Candidatus Eiseniibacteriota bacterium]